MYFIIALICAAVCFFCSFGSKEDRTSSFVVAAVVFCLTWLILWRVQTAISFQYGWWWIGPLCAVSLICLLSYADCKENHSRWIPFALLCVVLLGVEIFSGSLFHAYNKQRLLEVAELPDSTYCRDVAKIGPESMNLVDEDLAIKYANAVLEQDPATGSVCRIKEVYMQNISGTFNVKLATGETKQLTFENEQVYIAPLEHSGFWKWNKQRVTPGYIIVSAMKQNVVYFVRAVDGEELNLRYLSSGYFRDYYKRYLRHHGCLGIAFDDNNIEVNDEGRPYMVLPVYHYSIGYSGREITSVVVFDIQTGKIEEYEMDEVPGWIDRVYSSNLLSKRINWWGSYVQGLGNALFAKRNVRKQTPGIEQVYSEGQCYWYTGISSAGADNATSGFMLIDTRTGKANLYNISGINEVAASKNIAAHKIDAASIEPSRLLMYNIANEPTYFATAKNTAGEKIGYAFASVKRRDVCGVGKEINEAYNNYLASLRSSLSVSLLDSDVNVAMEVYTIRDICVEKDDYYIIFNETNGEFICPMDISRELKWSRTGDSVQVVVQEGNNVHRIEYFDNQRVEL